MCGFRYLAKVAFEWISWISIFRHGFRFLGSGFRTFCEFRGFRFLGRPLTDTVTVIFFTRILLASIKS